MCIQKSPVQFEVMAVDYSRSQGSLYLYILKNCIKRWRSLPNYPDITGRALKRPETSPAPGLPKPELEVWDSQNQLLFRRKIYKYLTFMSNQIFREFKKT